MTPLLEGRALGLRRGARVLFNALDLCVHAGEIAVIAGPSGGGKTTLLRVLATLLDANSGVVLFHGEPARDVRHVRRCVSYVPQGAAVLPGTVADNVATGPRLHGLQLTRTEHETLLARVGLDFTLADRPAAELSGGERQRLALARSLANQPEVLLLDEPTSALDPDSAGKVLALIRSLAENGTAVVMVTHIQAHAEATKGRLLQLQHGQLVPA